MSKELRKVTPVPASDVGRVDQWGEGHAVGYFPVGPITAGRLAEIVRDPFAGLAGDE